MLQGRPGLGGQWAMGGGEWGLAMGRAVEVERHPPWAFSSLPKAKQIFPCGLVSWVFDNKIPQTWGSLVV